MSENNMQYEVVAEAPVEEAAPVKKSAKIMGIIGMICGILGLCTFYGGNILCPIAGLILSGIAKKGGEAKFSKVGKITSVLGLIFSILTCIGWFGIGLLAGFADVLENIF